MKQDLTTVIRWPFLFLFASTTYLIASSLLLWHAQFLHSMQYQLVRFLHTIQWPLARNPWWLLSTSLTLNTGLPSQYLNLFATSWLNSLAFDFNVLRTSLFGEWQVSLAIELVHSESFHINKMMVYYYFIVSMTANRKNHELSIINACVSKINACWCQTNACEHQIAIKINLVLVTICYLEAI